MSIDVLRVTLMPTLNNQIFQWSLMKLDLTLQCGGGQMRMRKASGMCPPRPYSNGRQFVLVTCQTLTPTLSECL